MTPSELACLLHEHRVFPFHFLSAAHREEAAKAIRVRHIDRNQSITLTSGESDVTVYLLGGRARIEQEDKPAELVNGVKQYPVVAAGHGAEVRVTADEPAVLGLLESALVDELLFWDQTARFAAHQCDDCGRRMEQVKYCRAFRDLAPELLPDLVQRLEARMVSAGEEIVRQGEPGTAFYLLSAGRAEVWEQDVYDPGTQKVNELLPGDSFGEQALITDGTRSATVRMVEDGEVLILEAETYRAMVSNRALTEIGATQVHEKLRDGYRLLDVRYEEENEESRIPGSQLLPLQRLRQRRSELDPDARYVVYCRSGKRSAVAAVLMGQFGVEAVSLRGGILDWPFETESDW